MNKKRSKLLESSVQIVIGNEAKFHSNSWNERVYSLIYTRYRYRPIKVARLIKGKSQGKSLMVEPKRILQCLPLLAKKGAISITHKE